MYIFFRPISRLLTDLSFFVLLQEIASYFTSLIQESSTDVEVEEEVAQSEDTEPSDS